MLLALALLAGSLFAQPAPPASQVPRTSVWPNTSSPRLKPRERLRIGGGIFRRRWTSIAKPHQPPATSH